MDPDDLISFSDAAREIGCSRTTLYRAADDGRLNAIEVGGRRMLIKDEAWDKFEPNLVGARMEKLEEEDEDTNDNSQ
jgi:excisionase family DNA binding protein